MAQRLGHTTACNDTRHTASHQHSAAVSQDEEEAWFLNHYKCPCGEAWSNEDDCTLDDRCPTCRTPCSPTESQDITTISDGG